MVRSRRLAWLAALASLAAVAGVVLLGATVADLADGVRGAPSVVDREVGWGAVTADETEVRLRLEVRNPNAFAVDLRELSVRVATEGPPIEAAAPIDPALAPETVTTVTPTFTVATPAVVDAVAGHLLAGERTEAHLEVRLDVGAGPVTTSVSVHGGASAHTDLADRLGAVVAGSPAACPPGEDHPHPDGFGGPDHRLHPPCIEASDHRWAPQADGDAALDSTFRLRNPNPFPLDVGDRRAQLRLHGIPVAEGHVKGTSPVPAGGTETVQVRLQVDEEALARWWPRHVHGDCESSPASLALVVDVDGPAGSQALSLTLPWRHDVETSLLC